MFDTAPTTTIKTQPTDGLSWPEKVAAGDIISFRFPTDDTGEARPKARPCLVLAVAMVDGKRWMSVAYGTTVLKKARNGRGILVNASEAAACGLDRATGFRGDRLMTINTGDPALAVSPVFRTPVLGRLSGRPLERLRQIRDSLRAETTQALC
ncbi:hypothetical protein [Acidimangrovimonas pyrenivorans]|uniref:Type II toxin-antitoxin system PemK/MazF family toxin n=1 Tax=Acidimangrovimonas pyrenivorans TaxID=2030798 RepID=A0ABV7AG86_9RHOB